VQGHSHTPGHPPKSPTLKNIPSQFMKASKYRLFDAKNAGNTVAGQRVASPDYHLNTNLASLTRVDLAGSLVRKLTDA